MIDDHIPFLQQDIPATLIIDFDYPFWHTSQDNLDKVSADNLKWSVPYGIVRTKNKNK
jgi:hypothetical protein